MTRENALHLRLPVTMPPIAGELLSSWISRHAIFYVVPPLIMLRHCLPEASSLRAADLDLSDRQISRLADIFAAEPETVRWTTFSNVVRTSRRMIATKPLQTCQNCMSCLGEPRPILRSQLLGWRITCPLCGNQLRSADGREIPSPFHQYWDAALRGERLLDDEAERGIRTWTSPAEIAQLLLMRRIPRPLPSEVELWRFRVLGAIIPDLDDVIAVERANLPTPASPVLPVYLRPALLAGVAIVEQAGPEMLQMLREHTLGANRTRLSNLADRMTPQTSQPRTPSQLQLI